MKFNDITEEMNALYERKNHDYGNSFSETFLDILPPLKRVGFLDAIV